MTLHLSKPLDTSDPMLMSDDERRAFMTPDPDHFMRVGIMTRPIGLVGEAGYRGITASPNRSKFYARIQARGTRYRLGTFPTAIDAARAYDAKAKELHGELAVLNFPDLIQRFDWAAQIGQAA